MRWVLPLIIVLFVAGTGAVRAQAPAAGSPAQSQRLPLANPYRSLLPPEAEPDWTYWRAWQAARSRARAAKQPRHPLAVPAAEESEPIGTRGANDTLADAELQKGFGTGAGDQPMRDLAGQLSPAPPESIGPFAEDDGDILQANETGLTTGRRIRVEAEIGDGPYGSRGAGSGDYDVYRVADVLAGQHLVIDIDTPPGEPEELLDSIVGVFSAAGDFLDRNDDGDTMSKDAYLTFMAPQDGDYYVFVRGINSSWPSDPFDSASGPKAGSEGAYTLTLGLDAEDLDFYGVALEAGDILGVGMSGAALEVQLIGPAGQLLVGARHDGGVLFPEASPLPAGRPYRASAAYVIPETGTYAVGLAHGEGAYTIALRAFRPVLEGPVAGTQVLFLDFDGATVDAQALFGNGNAHATLSPLTAFLENFGLRPEDEGAVIDAILAAVEAKLTVDLQATGLNPQFAIDVRNSRDDDDPFGQALVSRVIVGGTQEELGLQTIGTAESVDVGNFVTEETAVVLLDRLSEPGAAPHSLNQFAVAPGVSRIDLLGRALGSIIVHEAGHLFANFHTGTTNSAPNLMDPARNFAMFFGIGEDGIFGTDDDEDVRFGPSAYHAAEGYFGIQDTRNAVAFGLPGDQRTHLVDGPDEAVPHTFRLDAAYPNPFNPETGFTLHTGRPQRIQVAVYDLQGRRVRQLHEGLMPAGEHRFTFDASALPSGTYVIRAAGDAHAASRVVTLLK